MKDVRDINDRPRDNPPTGRGGVIHPNSRIDAGERVQYRLEYLSLLNEIGLKNTSTQLNLNARIKAACDAIETDLGIIS